MPLQPPSLRALALLPLLALACSSEGDSGSSAAAGTQSTSGRFQQCGEDTMLDTGRNLQWEIKSGAFNATAATFKGCDSQAVHSFARTCPDTRSVMNRYTYCDNSDNRTANCDACQRGISNVRTPYCQVSRLAELQSGSVFYDFIDVYNSDQFAGHANWRLPTSDEIASIMVGGGATTDQPQSCTPGIPCIDGAFSASSVAAFSSYYWTSDVGSLPTLSANLDDFTRPCKNKSPCETAANFGIGAAIPDRARMNVPMYARAVRDFQPGDSCGP